MKDRTCRYCGKEYDSWHRNKVNGYHPNGSEKCLQCIEKENNKNIKK